eukprot:TRINITY_DN10145_c0_g2_i1.p1 TRINITY_DN10145_c0_g2~~TRINITY_DN10145_c0_g2_i1.p1  ORF type:complete len:195 (+),score=17.34 TRINITY_DN10145_c0_g2_i1:39-587(+)
MPLQPGERRSGRPTRGFPPGITSGLPVPPFFLESGSRSTALDELRAKGIRTLAWQASLSPSGPQSGGGSNGNDDMRAVAQQRQEAIIMSCSTEAPTKAWIASGSAEQPTFASSDQVHREQQGAESAQYHMSKPRKHERRDAEAFRQVQIPPMLPRQSASEQTLLRHPGNRMIVTESGVVFKL